MIETRPGGQLAPRRAHGDARQERRDRHVADVLVDEVGRLPERVDVDAGVVADARERRRQRLGRDAVRRERDRVDGAGDQVDAGAGGLEREREPVPAGALAVEADGKPGQLAQLGDRARRRDAAGAARRGRRAGCARRRSRASGGPSRRARRDGSSRRAARRRTRGRRRPRPRAATRRFSASFSGSWRRNESMPLSAALAMNRRTRSSPSGREPTRNRPRTASMSGVVVRALIARIRSHGLSTPRRTAASNAPPPETSR